MPSSKPTFDFQQAMIPSDAFKTGFKWAVEPGPHKTIDNMYSIALVDIKDMKVIGSVPGLDPHGVGGGSSWDQPEHYFTVPPKVIDVGEPYTTKITPTQGGGKFVESHGSIIRDIRVQGTSGLRPNKPLPPSVQLLSALPLGVLTGPANSIAGPIINRVARVGETLSDVVKAFKGEGFDERRLDKTERTGYDDIMKLRNIFRHYSDIKAAGGVAASRTVMVWRDVRTADYWVVEPTEFKLAQDSKSPLTYNYILTLKTISKFAHIPIKIDDVMDDIRSSQNLVSTIQTATRELTNTLLVVSSSVDRLTAAGVFAQNLIMEPILGVVNGATAITNSAQSVLPSLRENWTNLNNSLAESVAILKDKFHQTPDIPTVPSPVPLTSALTQEEQDNLDSMASLENALHRAQRAVNRVLTSAEMLNSAQTHSSRRKANGASAYKKAVLGGTRLGVNPVTGGDLSFLGNDTLADGVARAAIGPYDTIQSLSQKLLGNRSRWKLLAILNDLKPPYISSSGAEQTLGPGDYILYPVDGGAGATSVVSPTVDIHDKDQYGMNVDTAIEKAYGRDIRLKSDGENRTDIMLHEGDFATIQGVPNVKQAMRLKLSTEQGTLTVHPAYGAAFPIGKKATSLSFNTFRLNVMSTLLSDTRVSSISKIAFAARGDVLSIGASVILKDIAPSDSVSYDPRGV